jgi:hypothetical protein
MLPLVPRGTVTLDLTTVASKDQTLMPVQASDALKCILDKISDYQ